ncbi:MAG: hypothetical protein HQK51_21610 [Oligoflexia bacterium]|nr:hypothetical protein [Oligoflexia bacterium]
MSLINLKIIGFTMVAMLSIGAVNAASINAKGKVTSVISYTPYKVIEGPLKGILTGGIVVGLSVNRNGVGTGPKDFWAISAADEETAAGKTKIMLLQSALLTGKQVTLYGEGLGRAVIALDDQGNPHEFQQIATVMMNN